MIQKGPSYQERTLDTPVTVLSEGKIQKKTFAQLFPEYKEVTLRSFTTRKELQLIQDYYNLVVYNKAQVQNLKSNAGLQGVRTNNPACRGASRQKRSLISGRSTVVRGAPNNVGGRSAFTIIGKQKNKEMNKKVKALSIKALVYHSLLNSELYLLEDSQILSKQLKTSAAIKKLGTLDTALASYLEDPKKRTNDKLAPVLLLNALAQTYFRNYPKILNLRTSTDYFGLYNGSRFRKACIFTKDEMSEFLGRIFKK